MRAAQRTQEQRERGKQRDEHVPVHLMDIHLEKGMHCVDCHFVQDIHGNTKLYGEVRAAIEIQCIDCHGTIDAAARRCAPRGPAAPDRAAATCRSRCARPSASAASSGRATGSSRTRWSRRTWLGSRADEDTINPASEHYNVKSQQYVTCLYWLPDYVLAGLRAGMSSGCRPAVPGVPGMQACRSASATLSACGPCSVRTLDLVAGADVALGQHPEVEPGTAVGHQ